MYHDLSASPESDAAVTPQRFAADMESLAANGYSAISFKELEGYVTRGAELPEKPVVITFDDGYRSNLTYAPAAMEGTGMKATVNVIGMSVGKSTYKDTGAPIIPHFSFEEARMAYAGGLMDFQSHSWAMHDSDRLESEAAYREGVLPRKGEGEKEYIEAFRRDVVKSKTEMERNIGGDVFVYAYPYGFYSDLAEALLREEGFTVTLSIDPGANSVVKGLPQSLRKLRRIAVNMRSPDAAALAGGRF
jgi:peptidoglycan/xylan/chitin deacetylase (PgdA/CDA1 family)